MGNIRKTKSNRKKRVSQGKKITQKIGGFSYDPNGESTISDYIEIILELALWSFKTAFWGAKLIVPSVVKTTGQALYFVLTPVANLAGIAYSNINLSMVNPMNIFNKAANNSEIIVPIIQEKVKPNDNSAIKYMKNISYDCLQLISGKINFEKFKKNIENFGYVNWIIISIVMITMYFYHRKRNQLPKNKTIEKLAGMKVQITKKTKVKTKRNSRK